MVTVPVPVDMPSRVYSHRGSAGPVRRVWWVLAMASLCCAGRGAWAQAPASGLQVAPTLSVESGLFETRSRQEADQNGREGVVRLSPGLRVSSFSGRLRGNFDYSGNLYYRRGRAASAGSDFQNALSSAFTAEAVNNHLFVDVAANVSQQAISAFGQQAVEGSAQTNVNRTEVATASVSPYFKGRLGSWAEVDVRLTAGMTDSRGAQGSDSRTGTAVAVVRSPVRARGLGWSLTANQTQTAYRGLESTTSESAALSAGLSYRPDPDWSFSASAGSERVDSGGAGVARDATTSSIGLQWQPSVRTSLQVDLADRYVGRTGRVSFSHRMPRSIVSYALTKDTSSSADGLGQGKPVTLYQLLFQQKASAVPDPVDRDQVVLAELAALGVDPNQTVSLPVLVSSYSVQNRQDLSWVWTGLRTTFTAQAYASSTRQVSTAEAEASFGEATVIHGYTASVAHRLTARETLTLGGSRRMTSGNAIQAGNDLKSAFMTLNSQFGRRTSLLLTARYAVFNSVTTPYRETALSGSLNLRF